jgi:hypothetical protein
MTKVKSIDQLKARIPTVWGKWISCESGWYPLLLELDEQLAALSEAYVIHQVKEKFGGLRFYPDLNSFAEEDQAKAMELIREAELKAAKTCELCSKPAKLVARNFNYRTLCSNCALDNQFEAIEE